MVSPRIVATALVAFVFSRDAGAAPPSWRIHEIFSNADGSVQFIELFTTAQNQDVNGLTLVAGGSNIFTFPSSLPSMKTANRFMLIATGTIKGIAPDYTIPQNFFNPSGDTLDFGGGTDRVTFTSLPTDGEKSIDRNGNINLLSTPANFAGVIAGHVLTQHNDRYRTGAVQDETVLTPALLASGSFGKIFTRKVLGQIYAQPLYVPNVAIPKKGTHNVVFVATEHNMVYAFDADIPALAAPLWSRNLGTPASWRGVNCDDLKPEIGITATPVIDMATGTIYIEAKTFSSGEYAHKLHALDIATGEEKFGGPVPITASVPGTGDGSDGTNVAFNPKTQHVRPGLLLSNGVIYLASASHCDNGPYHGWVLGYDAATLAQLFVFNDTPNGSEGGIWNSGNGLAADDAGNIYTVTGNGTFDVDNGGNDYGDSFIKLTPSLTIADFFTPYNQAALEANDLDLTSGVTLAPGTLPGQKLMFGGGKQGVLYLLDSTHMGGYNNHNNDQTSDTNIVQSFPATPAIFSPPVFWNSTAYLWGVSDSLRALPLVSGSFDTANITTGTVSTGFPGGPLSVSANGNTNGIVWGLDRDGSTLHAFDAANIAHEIWNSEQNPARDHLPSVVKFTPPTIARGRVYVATASGELVVYGVLPNFPNFAGSYEGIAANQAAPAQQLGLVHLQLTSAGGFTMSLVPNGGATFRASGFFDSGGHFSAPLTILGTPLTLTLDIDFAGAKIIGSVTDDHGNNTTFTLPRTAFNAHTHRLPAPFLGKYTIVFQKDATQTNGALTPQGHGYGTVSVDAGANARFAGKLGDGSAASFGGKIADDFSWPFFIRLRHNNGSVVAATLHFFDPSNSANTNHIGGAIDWFQNAGGTGLYTGTFTLQNLVLGSKYTAKNPALDFSGAMGQAHFMIDGGNFSQPPPDKIFTLNSNNVTLGANDPNGPFKLTISTSTGLFKGTFSADGKTRAFGGAALQLQEQGYGTFVGILQTGSVLLTMPLALEDPDEDD